MVGMLEEIPFLEPDTKPGPKLQKEKTEETISASLFLKALAVSKMDSVTLAEENQIIFNEQDTKSSNE